jgi:hypothetical protein
VRNDSHFERGAIEVDMERLEKSERCGVSEMELGHREGGIHL